MHAVAALIGFEDEVDALVKQKLGDEAYAGIVKKTGGES